MQMGKFRSVQIRLSVLRRRCLSQTCKDQKAGQIDHQHSPSLVGARFRYEKGKGEQPRTTCGNKSLPPCCDMDVMRGQKVRLHLWSRAAFMTRPSSPPVECRSRKGLEGTREMGKISRSVHDAAATRNAFSPPKSQQNSHAGTSFRLRLRDGASFVCSVLRAFVTPSHPLFGQRVANCCTGTTQRVGV